MLVLCPKDGYVIKVYVGEGSIIRRGEPLLRLDTDEEEKLLLRVLTLDHARDIISSRLSPEQLKVERGIAQVAIDLAEADWIYKKTVLSQITLGEDLGTRKKLDRLKAEADVKAAKLNQDKASLQLAKLEFQISSYKDLNGTVAKHLSEEKALVSKRMARFEVVSPHDGTVNHLKVESGSFMNRGGVLLEIA